MRLFQQLIQRIPLTTTILVMLVMLSGSLLLPQSPLRHGELIDADDYTHLLQAQQLLDGGGWYNTVIARMDPFRGTEVHYARIVDGTLAAFLWLADFALPRADAFLFVATVMPCLLLLLFGAGFLWAMRPLLPGEQASYAIFFLLCAEFLILQFQPGRVDHHAWQVALMVWILGAAFRFLHTPQKTYAFLLGGLAATSLAISVETLPWLLFILGMLGVVCALRDDGRQASQQFFLLCASMAAGATGYMLLLWPPDEFFTIRFTSFAFPQLCLTYMATLVAFGIAQAQTKTRRIAALIAYGTLAAIVYFIGAFPQWLGGPYGGENQAFKDLVLPNVSEASPLFLSGYHWAGVMAHIIIPLAGMMGVALQLRKKTHILPASLVGLLLIISFLAAGLFQTRIMIFCNVFGLMGVALLLANVPRRFLLPIVAALPLLAVIIPYSVRGDSFSGILTQFVLKKTAQPCDLRPVVAALNGNELSRAPLNIATSFDDATPLLLHTSHAIFAAPYDVSRGNRLIYRLFREQDETTIKQLMNANKIGAVLVCRALPEMYRVNPQLYGRPPRDAAELQQWLTQSGFAERLVFGNYPGWLTPVTLPPESNYRLYTVKQSLRVE